LKDPQETRGERYSQPLIIMYNCGEDINIAQTKKALRGNIFNGKSYVG
jgi:hypothetical protein